jgi:hypothetical protein
MENGQGQHLDFIGCQLPEEDGGMQVEGQLDTPHGEEDQQAQKTLRTFVRFDRSAYNICIVIIKRYFGASPRVAAGTALAAVCRCRELRCGEGAGEKHVDAFASTIARLPFITLLQPRERAGIAEGVTRSIFRALLELDAGGHNSSSRQQLKTAQYCLSTAQRYSMVHVAGSARTV